MARELEEQELLDLQIEHYDTIANKFQEFEAKGKKPFRYDPYGSGIMPQDIFDDLRDRNDPDYKKKEDLIHHSDGHRKYPVNTLVLHHAVSDFMVGWSDLKVRDWFDRVGKSRGYTGVARSYHRHPNRNKETFAQAHYGAHIYTANKNKYGYRLTTLMKDVWNNVAWHSGNWAINQRSLGAENAGNYVNKKLTNKQLMLYADTLRDHDRKVLKGNLKILCHKQITATACPGKICSQVPTLIDMFNNPAKWNAKLWPKPKTKTAPKPKTIFDKVVKSPIKLKLPTDTTLVELPSKKKIKTIKKGTVIDIYGIYNGKWRISKWSFAIKKPYFFTVNIVEPPKPPEKPKKVEKREEVKPVSQEPVNLKSGVKTTEFYIALIPYALMILKTVFNIELEQELITNGILGIVSLVTTGFYIWSRVQVKLSANSK